MSTTSAPEQAMRLYDKDARRLYINANERARFLAACKRAMMPRRCLGLTLLYTGCRISEALALTPRDIQFASRVITYRTLKRRRRDVFREVPIPQELADVLQGYANQTQPDAPLWQHRNRPLNRSTAYRWIKRLMAEAEITGVQACPKGLRHGFGIHALNASIPLNLLQKWMGHAEMSTTAIYADASGMEERGIAERMW
jgi:integrase